MTKSRPVEPQCPSVGPEQGIELIKERIAKANSLLKTCTVSSDHYNTWELLTRNYLEKVFGADSTNVNSVMDIGKYGSFPGNASGVWQEKHRVESLKSQIQQLEGLIEILNTDIRFRADHSIAKTTANTSHKVFLVHGHDERFLHETARFLEKLKQDFVILREQPNEGRTIIEKFENHADVGFAVVLLTSDDRGGTTDDAYESQKPRARQNVILELGYFLGRIGRKRVCALYAEGVEIPSDYDGVIYVPLDDSGAWKLSLAKEIKAAGLPVDMNLM